MKRSAILSAVAAVLVGGGVLAHAADKPKAGPTTKPAATQPSKPVNKFCAVEGKGHDVDPKVTTKYKDKTIGFCCADCVDEFNKDPEKYMKKLE